MKSGDFALGAASTARVLALGMSSHVSAQAASASQAARSRSQPLADTIRATASAGHRRSCRRVRNMAGDIVGLLGVVFAYSRDFLVFSYSYSGVPSSVQTHLAIATSLFIIIFTSLVSAFQQYKQHNIYWPAVFAIGFSSALTALGTARLASGLSGKYLRIVFALIVIVAGIRMLTESKAESQKKLEFLSKPSIPSLIGIGLASGVVSALAGVGGGVITIPIMYYFLKMPLTLTIGTSSATVIITAFFSVVGYILSGMSHADVIEDPLRSGRLSHRCEP